VRGRGGEGGRNDPNIVCTYELKKKNQKKFFSQIGSLELFAWG
jgi:hypothetical protein